LSPEALVEHAQRLIDDLAVAELEPARRRWLEAQVRSLHTTARRVAGESVPYAEEVELSFGIAPRWHDEKQFERARYLPDDLLPALRAVAEELRARTRALAGLPEGEEIELELVSGKRWGGFNLNLGDLRSRISINTDLPFPAADLAYYIAHEGYPGHHTDGAW